MIWKKQPVGSKLADLQNNKAGKDTATQSAAGLMSAADKTKLDGVATGATAVSVVNGLNSDSTTSALSAAQGKALNSNLSKVGHTTTITATTLADLKTNLLNAVNGVNSGDMIAVRISPSFSSDGFTSGSTYGGYAYNIYKASGVTSYFSVILSNNIGEDMVIGYSNGTWEFTSLNSKVTPLTDRMGVVSLSSTNPISFSFPNGYGSLCFFGFIQGLGSYPIAIIIAGDTLQAKQYLINGDNFTFDGMSFSYNSTSHVLTITQTRSAASNLMYIKG